MTLAVREYPVADARITNEPWAAAAEVPFTCQLPLAAIADERVKSGPVTVTVPRAGSAEPLANHDESERAHP